MSNPINTVFWLDDFVVQVWDPKFYDLVAWLTFVYKVVSHYVCKTLF